MVPEVKPIQMLESRAIGEVAAFWENRQSIGLNKVHSTWASSTLPDT